MAHTVGLIGAGHRPVAQPRPARARGRRAGAPVRRTGCSTSTSSTCRRRRRRPAGARPGWPATTASTSPTPASRLVVAPPRRAVPRRRGARRGQHRRLRGRPGDRPQHRLVRLRARPSTAGCPTRRSAASCCSAPAARARRSRTRCCALGAGRLTVVDVDPDRAAALAAELRALRRDRARRRSPTCRPSTAPTGWSTPRPPAWPPTPGCRSPAALLRPDLWVADIVYRPLETELVRRARRAGCRTLDGGGMAVFQAADAFRAVHRRRARRRPDAAPLRRARSASRVRPRGEAVRGPSPRSA